MISHQNRSNLRGVSREPKPLSSTVPPPKRQSGVFDRTVAREPESLLAASAADDEEVTLMHVPV